MKAFMFERDLAVLNEYQALAHLFLLTVVMQSMYFVNMKQHYCIPIHFFWPFTLFSFNIDLFLDTLTENFNKLCTAS